MIASWFATKNWNHLLFKNTKLSLKSVRNATECSWFLEALSWRKLERLMTFNYRPCTKRVKLWDCNSWMKRTKPEVRQEFTQALIQSCPLCSSTAPNLRLSKPLETLLPRNNSTGFSNHVWNSSQSSHPHRIYSKSLHLPVLD